MALKTEEELQEYFAEKTSGTMIALTGVMNSLSEYGQTVRTDTIVEALSTAAVLIEDRANLYTAGSETYLALMESRTDILDLIETIG